MGTSEPNPTLYVKNIDWKIKKGLLKRALYALFSRHGKVLEVVALRKEGLRGQAFVIMADTQAATAALQAENGFTFFGKDLVIEFARQKSTRIARLEGSIAKHARKKHRITRDEPDEDDSDNDMAMESDQDDTPQKEPKEEDVPQPPPQPERGSKQVPEQQPQAQPQAQDPSDKEMIDEQPQQEQEPPVEDDKTPAKSQNEPAIKDKVQEPPQEPSPDEDMPEPPPEQTSTSSEEPRSRILLATGFPARGSTKTMQTALEKVFSKKPGFQECRVPSKEEAFVEFDTEPHATMAMEALQGHAFSKTKILQLSYGKEEE